eukprot:scaffold125845_cov34-Tisochrysis_lutea.AAC.1
MARADITRPQEDEENDEKTRSGLKRMTPHTTGSRQTPRKSGTRRERLKRQKAGAEPPSGAR